MLYSAGSFVSKMPYTWSCPGSSHYQKQSQEMVRNWVLTTLSEPLDQNAPEANLPQQSQINPQNQLSSHCS